MQLTVYATRRSPHGASRSVLAMSPCSVKTRRAPSRHCSDARAYGHTTTTMHDNEYTVSPTHPLRLRICAGVFFFFFAGEGSSPRIREHGGHTLCTRRIEVTLGLSQSYPTRPQQPMVSVLSSSFVSNTVYDSNFLEYLGGASSDVYQVCFFVCAQRSLVLCPFFI